MTNLLSHLSSHGADEEAQQAAAAVLRYFNQAAPMHHADEEIDLLPVLKQTATDTDAALLQQLMPEIIHQHEQMHAQWNNLDAQLRLIKDGSSMMLSASDVQQFSDSYLKHMEIEETNIAPMAKRIFSQQQMQTLGAAMQARRGISVTS